MFELLVEILHKDDSWTREPYANCEIVRDIKTGELGRVCEAIKYPTRDACLAQLQKLDEAWRASSTSMAGPRAWVRWEMRCDRGGTPQIS